MNNGYYDSEARRCLKCRLPKALSEFSEDLRCKGGVSHKCDECRFGGSRAHYVENAQTYRDRSRAWQAANPERVRQYRAENADRLRELKRENYHAAMTDAEKREEYNEYHRRYRAANRDRIRQIQADHYERTKIVNPDQIERKRRNRRERERQAGWVTAKLKKAVYAHYGPSCYLCGSAATETDHYQPLDAGGATELENLRPACKGCNSRKDNVWPFDEAELRARILAEYAADRPSEVA